MPKLRSPLILAICAMLLTGCSSLYRVPVEPQVACVVGPVHPDKATRVYLERLLTDKNGHRKSGVPASLEKYVVQLAAQQAALESACKGGN